MKILDHDHFELSTGKKFYAFGCVISLLRDGLVYGWDGGVSPLDHIDFTPEENTEIADYIINQWQIWKIEYGTGK